MSRQISCSNFSLKLSFAFILLGIASLPLTTFGTHALLLGSLTILVNQDFRQKLREIDWQLIIIFSLLLIMPVIGSIYTKASLVEQIPFYKKFIKLVFLFVILYTVFKKYPYMITLALYTFLASLCILVIELTLIKLNIFLKKQLLIKDRISYSQALSIGSYLSFFYAKQFISTKYIQRLLYCLASIFVFSTFFLSDGRSGQLICIGLLCLFIIQQKKIKGAMPAIAAVIVLILAAYFFSTSFSERLNDGFFEIYSFLHNDLSTEQPTSMGLRMQFWYRCIQLWLQKFWVGWGTGSFAAAYDSVRYNLHPTDDPHNQFLNIAVQFGILGLSIFGLWNYFLWKKSFFLPKHSRDFILASMLFIFLASLTNSALYDFTSAHLFIFILSMGYSISQTYLTSLSK